MKQNLTKFLMCVICCSTISLFAGAQSISFSNSNSRLSNSNIHSGCAITVIDWNNDGLDDIVRMDQGHDVYVEIQEIGGNFITRHLGDFGGGSAWAMCVGDFDNNGYKDIVAGFGNTGNLMMIANDGLTGIVTTFANSGYFWQNITTGDFNNDGKLDIFACDDRAPSHIYLNGGAGDFTELLTCTDVISLNTGVVTIRLRNKMSASFVGSAFTLYHDDSHYFTGTVQYYDSDSGITVLNVTSVVGSGTYNYWSNNLTMKLDFAIHKDANRHELFLDDNGTPDPADSGNYGTVYSDFDGDGDMDLYIAKCRQWDNNPNDPNRIDVLFVNDGNNNYTNMDSVYGVANGWQTWTASFGDLDNDGDMDIVVTNHDHETQVFENDGLGHYADITASTNLSVDFTPIESVVEDFDNDGFMDILITGNDQGMWRNNGNMTFTKVSSLFDNNTMESFAIGDLNHDGFIDVYGSYANVYTTPTTDDDVLWINNANHNHFISFNLEGTVSNSGAVGARVTLYGAWGKQIREVKSGESYGTTNSSMLHFGIGGNTVIDSAVVRFPSGVTQKIINPGVDQFVTIIEGDCVSPNATVGFSGTGAICAAGQTVLLTAPAGYSYLWSTMETAQSIIVNTLGEYNVIITTPGNNCPGSSKTFVISDGSNDSAPVIEAKGNLTVCNGGTVELDAPTGALFYLWINGATTQNIFVNQSGNYILTTEGSCAQFNSNTISVNVIPPVADPTTIDQTIAPGTTASLTATGADINWYNVATGGIAIATGNNYTTPVLSNYTTYYVENHFTQSQDIGSVGLANHSGNSLYSGTNNINATISFDVISNCTLKSVKVITDKPGDRKIELRDGGGNLINSVTVNIASGTQVIDLNFQLAPGVNYTIGTDSNVNKLIPGWTNASPRLQRNSSGVNYPYSIQDVINITGSSEGNSYYYYFYDWQIERNFICTSDRIPVHVNVSNGINNIYASLMDIYPNPATDLIHVQINTPNALLTIYDATGRTLMQKNITRDSDINVSNLSKGVYLIKVSGTGINASKVIVIN